MATDVYRGHAATKDRRNRQAGTGTGLWPTPEAARAPHIIGLRCPIGLPNGLIERLQADRIYISQRKGTLRISPHLYNTNSDVDRLFEALGRMI